MPATSSDNFKVSFIGCGKVGMTSAYTLFLNGIANEIVLLGRCADTLVGEQLDLEHALSFVSATTIKATEKYEDIANSDIVVVTAGVSQKPGDTRLDLAEKNKAIMANIIPEVVKHAPEAIIVIVSNPVDVLTYQAYSMAKLPKGQIFGTGTLLDTSRFRFHVSEFLKVNPRSIHAYILGEHGDSSFPVVHHAMIGGQPLSAMPEYSEAKIQQAYQNTRDAAYKIIASKGSTYYAIAVAVTKVITTILKDARSVLPVSIPLHGQYGHHGVAISVPCVVGRNGVEEILETKLSWREKKQLDASVKKIKSYL